MQLYLALSLANHSQSISALPSIFGPVKIAWPLIQINQLLFCLVHHKGSNLRPDLKFANVAGNVIPLSDKVKILGATLGANLTMAPQIKALSSSCFIILVLSGRLVH